MFTVATRPEQEFLAALLVGEVRQGANEGVMHMLNEIESIDDVERFGVLDLVQRELTLGGRRLGSDDEAEVPEPGTLAFFVLGALAIPARRARRRSIPARKRPGMATSSPQKVVTSAMEMSLAIRAGSGMPPASRIEAKSLIMPYTVPKSPIIGLTLPITLRYSILRTSRAARSSIAWMPYPGGWRSIPSSRCSNARSRSAT